MPRKIHIAASSGLGRIIRGIDRKAIFRDNRHKDNFIGRIGAIPLDTLTPSCAWGLRFRTPTHPTFKGKKTLKRERWNRMILFGRGLAD